MGDARVEKRWTKQIVWGLEEQLLAAVEVGIDQALLDAAKGSLVTSSTRGFKKRSSQFIRLISEHPLGYLLA